MDEIDYIACIAYLAYIDEQLSKMVIICKICGYFICHIFTT